MSNLINKIKTAAITGLVAAAVLVPSSATIYSYYFPDKVRTVINDTQVKRNKNKDIYLIFTDAGVFKNTDAWYRGKFKSSDMQGKAMKLKGKQVDIEKYGWRLGLMSWYENVVGIEEVNEDKPESSS